MVLECQPVEQGRQSAAGERAWRLFTAKGREFTDRLFGLRKRAATGQHALDQLCADPGIEHRMAPPQLRQTNGMFERFNGRIEEVVQSHQFRLGEEMETTLHRYLAF